MGHVDLQATPKPEIPHHAPSDPPSQGQRLPGLLWVVKAEGRGQEKAFPEAFPWEFSAPSLWAPRFHTPRQVCMAWALALSGSCQPCLQVSTPSGSGCRTPDWLAVLLLQILSSAASFPSRRGQSRQNGPCPANSSDSPVPLVLGTPQGSCLPSVKDALLQPWLPPPLPPAQVSDQNCSPLSTCQIPVRTGGIFSIGSPSPGCPHIRPPTPMGPQGTYVVEAEALQVMD